MIIRTATLAFVIAFTGAVAPGPMLALVIGQVLAGGLMPVFFILLGHALIEALFLLCIRAGLSGFLARKKTRGALALLGGAALGWMGWQLVADAGTAELAGSVAQALPWYTLVAAGIGVSLSNPYFTGWWATVGTGQVATLGLKARREFAAFFFGHEMGDVVWYVFVALLLVIGRQWLTDTMYQALIWVCGVVLLALAVLFLFLGGKHLATANTAESPGEHSP